MEGSLKYDLIGDIHGHGSELEKLLIKLGYEEHPNPLFEEEYQPVYSFIHPDRNRKVIFVGDLIDRGPEIRKTLEIVKSMVDNGSALCIMGNHEYNAIAFWHQPAFRNPQSIKNINQHMATIQQFKNLESEWKHYCEWFKTLPILLDLPELRVVHAFYSPLIHEFANTDQPFLTKDYHINRNYWYLKPKQPIKMIETVLKGHKIPLPEGHQYQDKDGHIRQHARVKWWVSAKDAKWGDILEENAAPPELIQTPFPEEQHNDPNLCGYPSTEKPIFFGHYWLRGEPHLQTTNVCCLDYSVAKKGHLIAYQWSGEAKLDKAKFVTVEAIN